MIDFSRYMFFYPNVKETWFGFLCLTFGFVIVVFSQVDFLYVLWFACLFFLVSRNVCKSARELVARLLEIDGDNSLK